MIRSLQQRHVGIFSWDVKNRLVTCLSENQRIYTFHDYRRSYGNDDTRAARLNAYRVIGSGELHILGVQDSSPGVRTGNEEFATLEAVGKAQFQPGPIETRIRGVAEPSIRWRERGNYLTILYLNQSLVSPAAGRANAHPDFDTRPPPVTDASTSYCRAHLLELNV
jgi:hypothetical protein